MKFRFWFQEYTPAASMTMPPSASMAILTSPPRPSHYHVPRYYYLTERDAGEYDVPPAFRGVRDPDIPGYEGFPISTSADDLVLTPGSHCTGDCPHGPTCACYHQITSHFEMKTGSSSRGSPAAASMVYAGGHCHAPACLSIELYMNNTGTPELLCRQVSLYGKGDVAVDRFDEAGYVILPPCLWGTAEEGLQPPVYLAQGTPYATQASNPRLLDRVPGRSATHMCEPCLGQDVLDTAHTEHPRRAHGPDGLVANARRPVRGRGGGAAAVARRCRGVGVHGGHALCRARAMAPRFAAEFMRVYFFCL